MAHVSPPHFLLFPKQLLPNTASYKTVHPPLNPPPGILTNLLILTLTLIISPQHGEHFLYSHSFYHIYHPPLSLPQRMSLKHIRAALCIHLSGWEQWFVSPRSNSVSILPSALAQALVPALMGVFETQLVTSYNTQASAHSLHGLMTMFSFVYFKNISCNITNFDIVGMKTSQLEVVTMMGVESGMGVKSLKMGLLRNLIKIANSLYRIFHLILLIVKKMQDIHTFLMTLIKSPRSWESHGSAPRISHSHPVPHALALYGISKQCKYLWGRRRTSLPYRNGSNKPHTLYKTHKNSTASCSMPAWSSQKAALFS